jgi:hypothetical protein
MKCDVCGQGFRLYWERNSVDEQEAMRPAVLDELRQQHADAASDPSSDAHPSGPFNVPRWSGSPQFSGAALLGGLSTMRRIAPRELDYSS